MSKTISLIQRVEIASPCTASWDEMAGDERSRFCSECKLNVYNLSAMTQAQAEQLIIEKEGKLCARIYRRRDGTVITQDCPKGLAKVRRHALNLSVKIAAAVVFLVCSAAYALASSRQREYAQGLARHGIVGPTTYSQTKASIQNWLTESLPPRQTLIMGKVAAPPRGVCGNGR